MHKKQVGSVGGALIQINGFFWPVTYIASANMGSVFSSQALVLTSSTARRKYRGVVFSFLPKLSCCGFSSVLIACCITRRKLLPDS